MSERTPPAGTETTFLTEFDHRYGGRIDHYEVWEVDGSVGLYMPALEISTPLLADLHDMPLGTVEPPMLLSDDLPRDDEDAWHVRADEVSEELAHLLAEAKAEFGLA